MTKEDIRQRALEEFDKAQELEYKIGKFIVITAFIVELLNLVPGTLMGNLWLCPSLDNDFNAVLGRLLPTLGFVFAICALNGHSFCRYCLSAIYCINLFSIGLNLPLFISEFGAVMRSQAPSKYLMIFFMVTTVICLTYNMIMCISMLTSKNVSNYMYTKSTKG